MRLGWKKQDQSIQLATLALGCRPATPASPLCPRSRPAFWGLRKGWLVRADISPTRLSPLAPHVLAPLLQPSRAATGRAPALGPTPADLRSGYGLRTGCSLSSTAIR